MQNAVELGVLKSFEFVSQLRRASVITRQFGQRSGDIFVKGAPEAMKEICRIESCQSSHILHIWFALLTCFSSKWL